MKASPTNAPGRPRGCSERCVPRCKVIAGGTNLLDLMKLQIETPTILSDVQQHRP